MSKVGDVGWHYGVEIGGLLGWYSGEKMVDVSW